MAPDKEFEKMRGEELTDEELAKVSGGIEEVPDIIDVDCSVGTPSLPATGHRATVRGSELDPTASS